MTGFPLRAEGLDLGHDGRLVCAGLTLDLPPAALTAVIGPNGCGKSTLLRGLARLLPARAGRVLLDGRDIHALPTREVARRLGLLPQTLVPPEGITVEALVARGRYPHRGAFRPWTAADAAAVAGAMAATAVDKLAARPVETLSGGQRQRAWLAMVLAQETPLLLLDEPTTFLDIAHQVELLALLRRLAAAGRGVLAVLHDLNQACRYADHLLVMQGGRLLAAGPPSAVVTPGLIEAVFGLACVIVPDPVAGTPMVVPR
jgi:iron complex transport system ATP-binding protein